MSAPVLSYDQSEGLARAIVRKGKDVDSCAFESLAAPSETGAIYAGVVGRILAGQKGAFIRLGDNKTGFLNDAEGLQSGMHLMVQVKAEAREDKGVLLTRTISLPGVYLIYQPYGVGVHLSRRLDDAAHDFMENTVKKFLQGHEGGWVIRSAAQNASRDKVAEEIAELQATWKDVQGKQGLLVPPPSVYEQMLLSYAGDAQLVINIEEGLDMGAVCSYVRQARPALAQAMRPRFMLHAFQDGDLEHFFSEIGAEKVPLPGGGHVLFERTQSMQVIDVNAGARTAFAEVNREAATLIMQQIRWRNLGGMILVDFLRMRKNEDRYALADRLRVLAENDPAPVDVFGFTRMGLCEISRAKRGFSLDEARSLKGRA